VRCSHIHVCMHVSSVRHYHGAPRATHHGLGGYCMRAGIMVCDAEFPPDVWSKLCPTTVRFKGSARHTCQHRGSPHTVCPMLCISGNRPVIRRRE
jgi:hypothetical protein